MNKKDILNMNYTDFIAFLREENRCPGGKDSIRRIVQNSFINKKSKVLEVGSNNGFSSLEVAHISKAKMFGIDISRSCVKESNRRLKEETKDIRSRVKFQIGSAYKIPFPDNYFDLIITGGATTFMADKNKAINEYYRVAKQWSIVSVVQLYYHTKPLKSLLKKVSDIIGTEIKPYGEKDWLNVFNSDKFEKYYFERHELERKTKLQINKYVDSFLKKPHLKHYNYDLKTIIRNKWYNYIKTFNENNKYLGYFILLLRKRPYPEEIELFTKKHETF